MRILILPALIALPVSSIHAQDETARLEEIVVTADFREAASSELPLSVSVLNEDVIAVAGVQHFEDLLLLIPNLNWSGETSRPRFLQIRGIGEREQYQGAPNPSVGFVVDDIDFSGIGMVATLFDVERIEVLRGPQGTRYGANALAGLINVRTRGPSDDFELKGEIQLGDDNALGAGVAFGGPVGDKSLSYRVVAQQYSSDGFRHNVFLGRHDTNKRDELTTRAKLNWAPNEDWRVELTGMLVDLDNGYDAWVNDNTLVTRSDKPGEDSQYSKAGAVKASWSGSEAFELLSITTFADSDIRVSFDGDWGNDIFWGVPYDFTSDTTRRRDTLSQEFRLISQPGAEIFGGGTNWLAGIHFLELEETNDILDLFNGDTFRDLSSDYSASSTAVFGQLDTKLSARLTFSAGLRVEDRDASYVDSQAVSFSPSETMAGGHLSLHYLLNDSTAWYGSLVRGYKAGGFNIGPSIPFDRREFDSESLWSLETGMKGDWREGTLNANIGIFYSVRRDQQVSTSIQLDPADPLSFVFFSDNAAEGFNFGIEAEMGWQLRPEWRVDASVGLLDSEYQDFQSPTVALSGREQAHAPSYQFAFALTYRNPSGLFGRIDLQGRDGFYFDDSHDERSEAYKLMHVKFGYEQARWSTSIWVRNLLNEKYAVRGFYFSNDPNDPLFLPELFRRLGDPRQYGITASYHF